MPTSLWCAAVLFLSLPHLALTRAPAPAQRDVKEPQGKAAVVRGLVQDETGASLEGATVALRGTVTRTATSDRSGAFEFTTLPAGRYEIRVDRPGFLPLTRVFEIQPAERAFLTLPLVVGLAEQTTVSASRTGERDVQTVPIAVTALSAADLRQLQAYTVEDLAGRAPGLTFSQNTGFAQLSIRGIGTNVVFAGSDPSSAMYVDGVYLSRPAMMLNDFLDVERVEVLRGPQGTLYGRNAVGGAVNVITRTPSNDIEASASLVAGNLNTVRAEARASGPLIRDRLLASVAFLRGVHQGFVRDVDHPEHPLGGEDVTATRAKVHAVLSRRLDLLVSADVTHQDPVPLVYAKVLAVKPGFRVDNPPDLHDVRASTLAESRKVHHGGSARLTLRPAPDITFTSLTAYRKLDYELMVDADITELDLTISHVHEYQHQLSEELTVAQQRAGWAWVSGVFLLNESDRQPTIVPFGGLRRESHLYPEVDAATLAVFGQATARLASRLSATAGLRYTDERKTFNNAGYVQTLDAPVTVLPGTAYAFVDALSDSAVTPKAGLELRVRRDTMAYASATRGFKSGGFNLSSTTAGGGYGPESAWSYEGGLKTGLFHGRAKLNLAAFHMDYTDLQVQTAIRPGVLDISNAAEATIRGLELEGASTHGGPWQIGGHLSWLHSRYDRYTAVGPGGITGDVAGHRLNNAPAWSGGLRLAWNQRLRGHAVLSSRADATWQSTVYFTPFNDGVQRQRPYGVLDVSTHLQHRRRGWSIGVHARNLTGEDYITGTFASPPPAIGGRPGEPRRVSVQFSIAR